MPEWLQHSLQDGTGISWDILAVRLIAACLLGFAVSAVHRATRNACNIAPNFFATLVLLCVLIAMATQVIGDNVARAFSLVGALSIVRFRTVVKDTKDTAFVIFAVVVGMAAGAGQIIVALLGLLVVGAAAFAVRDKQSSTAWSGRDSLLEVRLGFSPELEAQVLATIRKFVIDAVPVSIGSVRQGAAMDVVYRVRLSPTASPIALISELHRVEGVQSASLEKAKDDSPS
ncbi:MAG TPA: DUF4956 domain-containing protein [Pirellulales bacterium]